MKVTIWQPKPPVLVDDLKSDFARKVGAFRAATGRPERFVTRCACAIHDKGFSVVYERNDPAQPFVLTGIYKDGESTEAFGAGAGRGRTLSPSEVDHTGWRCPYCESGQHIACDQCRATVCGGKTRRYPGTSDVFTCRASCGARGTLVLALSVTGAELAHKAAANSHASRQTATAPDGVLRLGAPTGAPRLK